MRVAHLFSGVQEWPPRLHGQPQGSAELQARHPGAVGLRVPLVQLGVPVDDLRVLNPPVAEVVDHGRDVEDAAQTLIKSRLTHDSALPRATARLSRGRFHGPKLAGSDPTP